MSLRKRLFLFVFTPVVVLCFGISINGAFQTRGQLIEDLDSDLRGSASSATNLLDQLTNQQIASLIGQPAVGSSRFTALVDLSTGEIVSQPATRDGVLLAVPDLPEPADLSRSLDEPFTLSGQEGDVNYRAIVTRLDGGRLFITAAPLDRIDALAKRLLIGSIIFVSLILLAMAGVVYVAIRSGLRPLREFIATTVRIAEGDLTERVETEQDDQAFAKIARATNHMMDEVEVSYEKERVGRQRLHELLTDAAHELRTPLTAIRGTVEMRSMGVLDTEDKLDTGFGGIDEHSRRMLGIVEGLIVIARVESSRPADHSPEATVVDLETVVRSQIEEFAAKHPTRRIDFRSGDADHHVAVEESLLRTAVNQLLDNAVGHTSDSAAIAVELCGDLGHSRLRVGDTGPGVPDEISDKVFDRFVRGDSSRARSTGGSGLGLSIVKSIADSANAEVRLLSNSADGCTFELMFPESPRLQPGNSSARSDIARG